MFYSNLRPLPPLCAVISPLYTELTLFRTGNQDGGIKMRYSHLPAAAEADFCSVSLRNMRNRDVVLQSLDQAKGREGDEGGG